MRVCEIAKRKQRNLDDDYGILWIDNGEPANAKQHLSIPEFLRSYVRTCARFSRNHRARCYFRAGRERRIATSHRKTPPSVSTRAQGLAGMRVVFILTAATSQPSKESTGVGTGRAAAVRLTAPRTPSAQTRASTERFSLCSGLWWCGLGPDSLRGLQQARNGQTCRSWDVTAAKVRTYEGSSGPCSRRRQQRHGRASLVKPSSEPVLDCRTM